MKITKKPLMAGGVAAVVAGGAFFYLGTELPGSAQAASQSQLIEQAQLTEAEAQEIALGEAAGDVTEVEVEEEGGAVIFEFEIKTDTGVTEVEVNGDTGEIVGTENEDGEDDEESEATKE
ncbi:PepSY domain-containing protein [Planococcus lenghuensis]|uniref:PepSY domain-containing protein n=1 Tax=Planococcus lenghuensis TaxID=2213202 RepID=A0A1Q2KYR1_9BACL|nr:PepSY domain-containing protein [Planococcus lenghuensis]AQQ53276.1 hypothetical protein B0X71_09415 [Planococcus lenghuensis]